MRSKLAVLFIAALSLSFPVGLLGCGGGYSGGGSSTPSAPTATTPGTQTTADCCDGPNGGYAGCSMQHPPNCQNSTG